MKRSFRQNGILILVAAVLLAAVIGMFSMHFGGVANPLANILGVVTTPVQNGISTFARWVEGIYSYSYRNAQLEEENARLHQELADMEARVLENERASQENERLRQLLGLREKRRDLELESATVVSRASTNWSSTLTISKGSVHGVKAGNCVVDQTGALVGVVAEVGLNWSTLITVIDADIELGGIISRTESAAIVEGDFALMKEGKVKLSYLPENTQLLAGDLVLTSGMGETYPSGLVVGSIESIQIDPSGLTRYAVVVPRVSLDELIQVFVIKDFDIVE